MDENQLFMFAVGMVHTSKDTLAAPEREERPPKDKSKGHGIDNNASERSQREIAVGRRNWSFFGSDRGGRTAAIPACFVASCKRLDITPFAHLGHIFARISAHPAQRLAELLPAGWKTGRAPPV